MERLGAIGEAIDDCTFDVARVESMWPGADDEERREIRATLQSVIVQLEPVICGRDVPFRLFAKARNLIEQASYGLRRLGSAEYSQKLSDLEGRLRAETTHRGWDAYLEIETLRSDRAMVE